MLLRGNIISKLEKSLVSKFIISSRDYIFEFAAVSEEENTKIITCLSNIAAGHDNIPMIVFKNYLGVLLKIITHICNMILS